ncbi:DNA polymerase IV [Mangrovibacillus cuniculi]|uniref:DNA polymerase IV n=1 Tax=Mangrovibacillus cuniculi TaxID=2593652 RepID=A0A7S8HFD4_9BACI|nr:DNA polymerase IV [Mangrovibacillus cuniculi]QPC46789.1 DNA polymerase IV [Mangrovibacillus cuniculi]
MKALYPKQGRVIFHVDMNSFYASVEATFDPSLRGKPIAVAGNVEERKGIIITCSYEARAYGVKTTMPLWEAKRLCPGLIILPPNFDRYRAASKEMFEILRSITELVEPVSIDEGYVDITQCYEQGTPLEIAELIQKRLLKELGLPCSIGIAPNKFLAKTASDFKKPLGITILRKRDVQSVLWPKKVVEMHGIGNKTAEKLNEIGIHTIGDLAMSSIGIVKELLGINGQKLHERANGMDEREVDPLAIYDVKTVGNSSTLPEDTQEEGVLLDVLARLSDKVALRLKGKQVVAKSITIQIKNSNWKMMTRSKQLTNPTDVGKEIFAIARQLFLSNWKQDPVRLLGVIAQEVVAKEDAHKQLDLFSYEIDAKDEPILSTLTKIQEKFGKHSIVRGVSQNKMPTFKEDTSFTKDFLQERKKE